MKTNINNLGISTLVRNCQCGIIKVRPILPSVITRAICLFETRLRAERGSRSSTIGVLVASVMWDAGNGCPFLLYTGTAIKNYGKSPTKNVSAVGRPRDGLCCLWHGELRTMQANVLPQAAERDFTGAAGAGAASTGEHGIEIRDSSIAAGNRDAQSKLGRTGSRTAERAACGNSRKRASVLHYGSNYHNCSRNLLHRKETIIELNHYEKVNRLNLNPRQVQERSRGRSGKNLEAEGHNQRGREENRPIQAR